ncbi:hypothetical protein AURANDRAFT_7420, partial [Aureococcus anophagefferens]
KTLQLRWFIEHSHDWRILEGVRQGHSQCYAHERAGNLAIFDHPVDVLLRVSSVKPAAPKLHIEVYQTDELHRLELAGYGFCHLPLLVGTHVVEILCWRPYGSWYQRITAALIGGHPQFLKNKLVTSSANRFDLRSETTGTVHVTLSVL